MGYGTISPLASGDEEAGKTQRTENGLAEAKKHANGIERDSELQTGAEPTALASEPTVEREAADESDRLSVSSSEAADAQAGVKNIEAISTTWTKWSLMAAYVGIFLVATSYSLEGQTTTNLTVYATSAFSEHSLVATVLVVQAVVNAVVKPPMAKISNVFGRLEAFTISILLYVLGYIQMAGSQNIQTFASAQIFYSAGFTGLLISQQIFIADTSDLTWRVFFASLPDIPFLFTVWCGPAIAQRLYNDWRWGYGLWAIVLPAAFSPLGLALFLNARKAARRGLLPPRPWKGKRLGPALRGLALELDIGGLLLLSAAIALMFLPLTLAATAGWANGSIVAMLVVGCVCLPLFIFWESMPRLAPMPFLSLSLLRRRSVAFGCAAGFFYYAAFYTSVFPYYNSYLQVVQAQTVESAGRITQTFSFASTVAAVAAGLLIKVIKVYKPVVLAGAAVYLMGIGLMLKFRNNSDSGNSIAAQVGVQIAVGIGGGLWNVPTQLAVQASVPHGSVAAATALYLTSIEIGGAAGTAIAGAIWTNTLPARLASYLPAANQGDAAKIFANLTLATSYPQGSPARLAINQAYQDTMHNLLLAAVALAAPVFLLSIGIKGLRLDQVDQRVRGTVIGSDRKAGGEEKEREREGEHRVGE